MATKGHKGRKSRELQGKVSHGACSRQHGRVSFLYEFAAEIEAAVSRLSAEELMALHEVVQSARRAREAMSQHSVLDIPPVHVGTIQHLELRDDLLGEMLAGEP